MNPILASSLPAKRFVDSETSSKSFYDVALKNSLFCLRNEGSWIVGESLGPIGWRLRKYYFKISEKKTEKTTSKHLFKTVSQVHQGKVATNLINSVDPLHINQLNDTFEYVLEWLEFGPDKLLKEKHFGEVLRSLVTLNHPHIETIKYASHNENGCVIIRKFFNQGSLKDMLCFSSPKNSFLSKYGNPKKRKALSLQEVATYGYQILNTLIFLHSKGYGYGHLHTGNIIITDQCVKLLNIENTIAGVSSFYRPFFMQHSKIHSIETIDVYCFGHVLFEMANGFPLQESVVKPTSDCSDLFKNLLDSILSKNACKSILPTLDQLIQHKFFSQYALKTDVMANVDQYYFNLESNAEKAIKIADTERENRLREEQKSVKHQKRIVRVQELMTFEEEKRKLEQLKTQNTFKQQYKLIQQNSIHSYSYEIPLASQRNLTNGVPKQSNALLMNQMNQHSIDVSCVEDEEVQSFVSLNTYCEKRDCNRTLLESICKFNRGSLRKVRSND